jgi:hypothetical protein
MVLFATNGVGELELIPRERAIDVDLVSFGEQVRRSKIGERIVKASPWSGGGKRGSASSGLSITQIPPSPGCPPSR